MPETVTPDVKDFTAQTSEIVAAYVARNPVQPAEIPTLIQTIYNALAGLGTSTALVASEPLKPAVSVRKSITPEYLICLEDGKKLKMLKRHLSSTYGMTPDEYRQKWGLPNDYPMVAPRYSEQRSDLAKKLGLGTQNRREETPPAASGSTRNGGRGGNRRASGNKTGAGASA